MGQGNRENRRRVQLRKEDRLVRKISEKELTKVIERRQQHRSKYTHTLPRD
jgi:hypothetical protein